MNSSLHARISRDSIATLTAYALLVIPALLLLFFIKAFGVNSIYWDEWEMISVFQKAMTGTLSFSDMFAQDNEHRMPFPKIAIMAIAKLTQYNTVGEMLFGWALVCLSALLIFFVYRRKSAWNHDPLQLLTFMPVSALLFSFRQYETILSGFAAVQYYLGLFGVIAALSFLELSKKTDFWFALSIPSAILATFSYAAGLALWPAGLFQILITEGKREWHKTVLWCLAGTVISFSYLYGYVHPPLHPPLTNVLSDPIYATRFFIILMGAPFTYDMTTAEAFGLVIVIIAAFVLLLGYKGKTLRSNGVWLSLVLFAFLFALMTIVGRGGFNIDFALFSRFTVMTDLGIIGLYFMGASISQELATNGKSFGVYALATLILIGLIVSYPVGWQRGETYVRYPREIGAYLIRTYGIQSDENIGKYLYQYPSTVRAGARFLEQNKWNVFSDRASDPTTLIWVSSDTLFALDSINDKSVSQWTEPMMIDPSQQETITITGWALDKQANAVASAVFVAIDGKIDVPAVYGLDRSDVASYFKNSNFRFSGYMATFSSSILSKGQHNISFKVVSRDGVHYYDAEQALYLLIN